MFGEQPHGYPQENIDLAQQGVGSDDTNYPLREDTQSLLVDAGEEGF